MNKKYTLNETTSISKEILAFVSNKKLLFYGEMGVGKTTLIKELCEQLGVKDTISSPTFSLVNEYKTIDNQTIYHFDFYRVANEEEAFDIGIEDYFDSEAWCFIEWPENIENLLPLDTTKIEIQILDSGKRHIQLK